MSAFGSLGKRALDLTLVVMTGPLWIAAGLVIALLVRITMGRPVLFRHVRPGYDGAPFTLIKFRTMNEAHDDEGVLLPDEDRLTRLGRQLRATSLDELPELWCVLKGEMSLVGPRPLRMRYLERYTPEQARRHDVLPGITGLAQVSGREDVKFSQRITLDVWYVDNWSFWLDLKILARTIGTVLMRRGIYEKQRIEEVDDLGLYFELAAEPAQDED